MRALAHTIPDPRQSFAAHPPHLGTLVSGRFGRWARSAGYVRARLDAHAAR